MWQVERTLPGIDASRDELLPFAGPAASLPLWSVLARLPFDSARALWLALLVLALVVLALAAAALAPVALTPSRAAAALLFAALTGAVVSDLALGQAAVAVAAGAALVLLALRRRAWWTIGAAAAGVVALTLICGGGGGGFMRYAATLAHHTASERFVLIQYNVPAIVASFGATPRNAERAGWICTVLALALAGAAALRRRLPATSLALIAIALLPWAVPFFHEHDFAIELLPAIVLAAAPNARVRALAAVATMAVFVDWLSVAQRPTFAAHTVLLALALACAFAAWPDRSPRAATTLPVFLACAAVTIIGLPLALAFPAPVWPDALGAFHAAAGLDASAVWAAEQHAAGLGALQPAWGVLRAIPMLGCAAFALAAYVAAEPAAITIRSPRTASGTVVSDSPSHGPATQ